MTMAVKVRSDTTTNPTFGVMFDVDVPTHLVVFKVHPVLHSAHVSSPSFTHLAPLAGVPFGHLHMLAEYGYTKGIYSRTTRQYSS